MFACIDKMINVDKIGMYFANTYLLKLFRRDSQFIKFDEPQNYKDCEQMCMILASNSLFQKKHI